MRKVDVLDDIDRDWNAAAEAFAAACDTMMHRRGDETCLIAIVVLGRDKSAVAVNGELTPDRLILCVEKLALAAGADVEVAALDAEGARYDA